MERVKLKKLLKNVPVQMVKGSKEIEITGITSNSKWVAPGNLFIAKKGITHDGARFIPDAVAAGAAAIVTDLYDPFYPHVVQIITSDIAAVEALIAKEFYEHADDELFLIGITGTNGKTTTSYLIRHLLEQNNEKCGLIGTVEWIAGNHIFPADNTTPDVLTNYKLFHEMRKSECKACVMEVSSHALDQGRVQGIEFDIGIFTNLTHEHLDYHKTMDEYASAKKKMFSHLKPDAVAIVNADSPYAEQMIADCRAQIFRLGVDLSASQVELTSEGMRCQVNYKQKTYPFHSPLIGRFNIDNLLAAAAVGITRDYPIEEILVCLSTYSKIPGRLERVPNPKGLNIFVDYAHKLDALINVLNTLQEIKKGRIITVFGCGGNRDLAKRPLMGAAAESLSDVAIVTSDNPRNEDPLEIIRQILGGFKDVRRALVIPDRTEAIHRAVQMASPDDIVLIAGKGHETYQVFSNQKIDFDDREIALEACTV